MTIDLFRVVSTGSWCGQEAISREVIYCKLTLVGQLLVARGEVMYKIMRIIVMCTFINKFCFSCYT